MRGNWLRTTLPQKGRCTNSKRNRNKSKYQWNRYLLGDSAKSRKEFVEYWNTMRRRYNSLVWEGMTIYQAQRLRYSNYFHQPVREN